MWVQSGIFICIVIELNLKMRFNFCARLYFDFICSVPNSPRQSANAEAFGKAYPCFLVSASAKKCTGN